MIVGHIGGGVAQGYEIEKSVRFRASNSAYLSRTPGVAGNRKTWTWSGWVKRGQLGTIQGVLRVGVSAYVYLSFYANDTLVFDINTGTVQGIKATAAVFRDPSAHYHIVINCDTTQATALNRMRMYINGVEITSWGTNSVAFAQNYDTEINGTTIHHLASNGGVVQYLDGYLSEINFIDGQALTPDAFGESVNGVWVPKKYPGTYGTNGFYLPFNDGSNLTELTKDRSGNANHWTASGISLTSGVTYDWMDDTPTNNFAVLNPLNTGNSSSALGFANMSYYYANTAAWVTASSTQSINAGKWYWEVEHTNLVPANSDSLVGIASVPDNFNGINYYIGQGVNNYGYYDFNGNKYNNGTATAYGATFTDNDVIGVALDLDAGTLTFYKNNVSQGVAFSGLTGTFTPAISSKSGVSHTNFGQRPFAFSPPTGFLPLCTKNLTSDTITTSGTFTGNASADGPFVWLNGNPVAMTINGNAVTLATHADKTAGGFKVRTSSSSYNAAGSNSYVVTTAGKPFNAPNTAQVNP